MINTTYTIARAEKGAQITHAQRFLNDEGERLACRCQGLKKFSNCQVVTFFLKRHTIFFPFVVGNKLSTFLTGLRFTLQCSWSKALDFPLRSIQRCTFTNCVSFICRIKSIYLNFLKFVLFKNILAKSNNLVNLHGLTPLYQGGNPCKLAIGFGKYVLK